MMHKMNLHKNVAKNSVNWLVKGTAGKAQWDNHPQTAANFC
jgi:hypothetical protein